MFWAMEHEVYDAIYLFVLCTFVHRDIQVRRSFVVNCELLNASQKPLKSIFPFSINTDVV